MHYHRNFLRTSTITNQLWRVATLLLSITSMSYAASEEPINIGPIVVTLKPLYSLVAHLSDGIETPTLLIQQTPLSHHYNMRPSERQALANARLIIWFGPQMEPYLTKAIQQQENSNAQTTVAVSAIQAKHLKLLGKRTEHSINNPQKNSDHTITASNTILQTIDPHIWLSTHNTAAISKHIAESLIAFDPENTERYKINLQRLLAKIKQTNFFINSMLNDDSTSSQQPFIAYHDAFQYFENEYQLNYIDSISYHEETGPGLKHMRHIKELIDEKNIQCLVYQRPKPAIINSLTTQTTIRAIALDPLGSNVSNNKDAWFELMQQLATDFKQCLQR